MHEVVGADAPFHRVEGAKEIAERDGGSTALDESPHDLPKRKSTDGLGRDEVARDPGIGAVLEDRRLGANGRAPERRGPVGSGHVDHVVRLPQDRARAA